MQDRNFDDIAEEISRNGITALQGQLRRAIHGRISIACWRKWARKNCVCWMLAVEELERNPNGRAWASGHFMRSFCR